MKETNTQQMSKGYTIFFKETRKRTMEVYDFSYKALKNMEIVRIFDYYNFPLFFISKSKDGLFFFELLYSG